MNDSSFQVNQMDLKKEKLKLLESKIPIMKKL